MILTIARHEVARLFKTGKIWKLLALCQLFLGFIFSWLMQEFLLEGQQSLLESSLPFGITEKVIHPLFAWTTLFFFFITPLLATHSLTQERKSGILTLYLVSPLSATEIILGKFFGILLAGFFLTLPTLLMPMVILIHDNLDFAQFLASIFGLVLLQSATLSLGFFIASLAKEPLMAALLIFITLLILSLLEWFSRSLSPTIAWVTEFALLYHCKNFLSGLISTKDILYYGLITLVFLYLSTQQLLKDAHLERSA